ncbi:MAG: hypothetical protein Q8O87_03185 [bacterium]|nr:hypothetical protein [bacterium]
MTSLIKKIAGNNIYWIGALVMLTTGYAITVNSQTAPQFITSWKANSYVPAEYIGKALPTRDTGVDVAFDLIHNNRAVNLTQTEVRWYLNNKFQTSGLGLTNFDFDVSNITHSSQTIRIVVMDYNGADLTKSVIIPVADPQVTMVKIANNEYKALPYFFNIASLGDLDFQWSANGIVATSDERPDTLTVNIQGGSLGATINISLSVKSLIDSIERAAKSIIVSIK